jgi:hypothetical protein
MISRAELRRAGTEAAQNPRTVRWNPSMGQRVKNVEAVTDFADNRHFIRLHRDIVLPAEVCDAVRRHLTAGRWQEAKSLTLEHAPSDAHEEVHLFFDATDERLATDDTHVPASVFRPSAEG